MIVLFMVVPVQIEARSIGHIKKLNQGMENKIMELQRKLDVAVSGFDLISMLASGLRINNLVSP